MKTSPFEMTNYCDYWVAEYSQSQGSYNVCRMDEMIIRNIRSVVMKTRNDWVMLGVFSTYEKADEEINYFRTLVETSLDRKRVIAR